MKKMNVHETKQNVFGLILIIPVLPLGVQADWSISSTNILKIQENTKLYVLVSSPGRDSRDSRSSRLAEATQATQII